MLHAGGNPLETPGMCGMCATSIGLGEAKTRIAGTATQPCYLKYDEFLETVVQVGAVVGLWVRVI